MSHLSSRLYEDEKDFQIILDLIARIRPPEHLSDYPVKVDIEENLAAAAVRASRQAFQHLPGISK